MTATQTAANPYWLFADESSKELRLLSSIPRL